MWYQGLCVVAPNTDQGCNRHCSTISLLCCLCITKPPLFFLCCVHHIHKKVAICVSDFFFFCFILYYTIQNEETISWNQKSDVQVVSMCTYEYHHLVCWYSCVTIHVLKTQMTNNSKHAGVHSDRDLSNPFQKHTLLAACILKTLFATKIIFLLLFFEQKSKK